MEMVVQPDPDAEFDKLQNEASSSTPKEKPKKKEKDAVKRRQTEPVAGRAYKKARILASTSTDDANSTIGSTGSKPRRGGFHNLLDRPSSFTRPVSFKLYQKIAVNIIRQDIIIMKIVETIKYSLI